MKVTCSECGKRFILQSNVKEKYETDKLCGKCRSRVKYLENVDKYRKIKKCPNCDKLILKTSNFCNSCSQIGERNHQWKEEKHDRKVYYTREWKEWRRLILERDDYICQMCGETEGRITAHHILPKRDYPKLIFNVDNGITLCLDCHSEVHFSEYEYVDYFLELLDSRPK